jgi:hypothetical protein
VAPDPPDERERAELHSPAVLVSVTAMGVLRGVVGFLSFLIAFDVRRADRDIWFLGAAAAAAQIGFLVGAALAPVLRRRQKEESLLAGALAVVALAGTALVFVPPLPAMVLLSGAVGAAASAGKQGFDSIVQRDAPDANRGRSFARFETQFQLAWVGGAIVPVIVHIGLVIGYALIAAAAALAALSYRAGLERARRGIAPPPLAIRTWTTHIGGLLRGGDDAPPRRRDDEDDVELGRLPIDGVEPPIDDDVEASGASGADAPRLSGLPDRDANEAELEAMETDLADPKDLPDLDWHA